jgi:hypothetical protein
MNNSVITEAFIELEIKSRINNIIISYKFFLLFNTWNPLNFKYNIYKSRDK